VTKKTDDFSVFMQLREAVLRPTKIVDPFPNTMEGDKEVKCFATFRAQTPIGIMCARYYPTKKNFWNKVGVTRRMHPAVRADILEANAPWLSWVYPISKNGKELDMLMSAAGLRPKMLVSLSAEVAEDTVTRPSMVLLATAGKRHATPKLIAFTRFLAATLIGDDEVNDIVRQCSRDLSLTT